MVDQFRLELSRIDFDEAFVLSAWLILDVLQHLFEMIDRALITLDRVVLLVVLLDLFKETVFAAVGLHGVKMGHERLVFPITAIVLHRGLDFIDAHNNILHLAFNLWIFSDLIDIVPTAFLSVWKRMIFDVLFELIIFA